MLTSSALDRLAPLLPALATVDREHVTPRQLFSLITVESLCAMIERQREIAGEIDFPQAMIPDNAFRLRKP